LGAFLGALVRSRFFSVAAAGAGADFSLFLSAIFVFSQPLLVSSFYGFNRTDGRN
jgi:hypothetical protein